MSLFDEKSLSRAIKVKNHSYELIKLLKENKFNLVSLDSSAGSSHGSLSQNQLTDVQRFKTIILRLYSALPKNARPISTSERDVEEFSSFFVSYLFSSFDYVRKPKPRVVANEETGCWCDVCARLTNAPTLKLKRVETVDKHRADRLEEDALIEIASSKGIVLGYQEIKELREDESMVEVLALVPYGLELIRRCKGELTDPSSLVLWRRFAWTKSGFPKKNFVLNSDKILEAEKTLELKIDKFNSK